jgi:assimilatory nitrate reductase catalytic subunit
MSVRTACPYCGVGCGVRAAPDGRGLAVEGDAEHPANLGRLCSKGTALGKTVGLEGRLLHPMIGTRRASWHEATQRVAGRFAETIARHGPET